VDVASQDGEEDGVVDAVECATDVTLDKPGDAVEGLLDGLECRMIPNPGVYLEYETITHNPTPVG
jgi:hypothetical protein